MNLPDPPTWISDGLCVQIGSDLWFPEQGESSREAKRICGICDQRLACLQAAIDRNEPYGIWGGLSERQRRKLRGKAA